MNRFFTFFLMALLSLSANTYAQFTMADITFWVGSGSKQAALIVDFNDSLENECLAWGYRFDGTVTAEQMLTDIAAADPGLDVVISTGFLNDILYVDHSGLAGLPFYWMTFSGSENSTWTMNMGISTELDNGDWFGCSYTDVDTAWNPLYVPENPVAAQQPAGISDEQDFAVHIYPNPCSDRLNIECASGQATRYQLVNTNSQIVLAGEFSQKSQINLQSLPAGLYQLKLLHNKQIRFVTVNKL